MFMGGESDNDKLPPTLHSLKLHCMRAHYQAKIWYQSLAINYTPDSPLNNGWTEVDGVYVPTLITKPSQPSNIAELVACKCKKKHCAASKKGGPGSCSCRKAKMKCTTLCQCDSVECQNGSEEHTMCNENDGLSDDDEVDDDDGGIANGGVVVVDDVDDDIDDGIDDDDDDGDVMNVGIE